MENNQDVKLMNIIRLPFVFIFYILYMILTVFIPSKHVSKIINIEAIERDMNTYFNHPLFLKLIALIITIIIFIYFE